MGSARTAARRTAHSKLRKNFDWVRGEARLQLCRKLWKLACALAPEVARLFCWLQVQHRPRRQQIERAQGKIPQNPKQNNHCAQSPYPDRRNEYSRQPFPANLNQSLRRQTITHKRQHQHSQRIHRPRCLQVPVQQLVNRSQRAASRAIPSGQIMHGTGRKDSRACRIESPQHENRRREKQNRCQSPVFGNSPHPHTSP